MWVTKDKGQKTKDKRQMTKVKWQHTKDQGGHKSGVEDDQDCNDVIKRME